MVNNEIDYFRISDKDFIKSNARYAQSDPYYQMVILNPGDKEIELTIRRKATERTEIIRLTPQRFEHKEYYK